MIYHYMPILDLTITLSLRAYCQGGNIMQEKRDFAANTAFLFFPVDHLNYDDQLNTLTAHQYLERVRVFYNIYRRVN